VSERVAINPIWLDLMDEATQVNLSRIDKNVLVKSNQSTDRDPRVQSFTKSMLKCYELM
jgi:hypothetical protein